MGSWGAPWASGRGCQAAQSSSLGMGGWSEEGRPEFTGVSCPEEGIILWLVEIHGAFSWRDLAVLLIKECYVSTPSARHNLLIIDDLGSTEMLVVLKCVHMDLQSLQAPYLTFTFIVIQAFCSFFFFPIWFWAGFYIYLVIPLQVPVMPSCLVRDSWVLSLVQTGWRFPLQGRVLSVGVCHPTSGSTEWQQH